MSMRDLGNNLENGRRKSDKQKRTAMVGGLVNAVWIGPGPPPKLQWSWPSPRRDVNKITRQPKLPAAWQTRTKSGVEIPVKVQKKKKNKLKKPCLADAQRAAWAHAHFIVHHGDAADARRFLTHPKIVADTPAGTLAEVRKLAAMWVPIWEQAAALVFSSSDNSDGTIDDSASRANQPPLVRDTRNLPSDDDDLTSIQKEISITTTTTAITCNAASETQATTAHTRSAPTTTTTMRYRTRSTTSKERKQAADDESTPPPLPTPTPTRKRRPKKRMTAPSACPKIVRVVPSKIPVAGLGFYLLPYGSKRQRRRSG